MSHHIYPNQHAPNRLRTYIEIHSTVLERFKVVGEFVGKDTLQFDDFIYGTRLNGEISCLGGIVIEVDKFLEAVDDNIGNPLVQTKWYSYNVLVRGFGNIFRYDNQDPDFAFREGHEDPHHKHEFDWRTGMELPDSPKWLGIEKWVKLDDVIRETAEWYWANYTTLPDPHRYGEIGARSGTRQIKRSSGGSTSLEL